MVLGLSSFVLENLFYRRLMPMKWYEWLAYAFILIGIYYYIMKNIRNNGSPRNRKRNKPFKAALAAF